MADDQKYIVFKRTEFTSWLAEGAMPSFMPDLDDAVVIRRRDLFASPCLATYASMIALVAMNIDDKEQAAGLLDIADYFERQANLAADEGFKLPDV